MSNEQGQTSGTTSGTTSGVTRRQAMIGVGASAAALTALGRLNGVSAQSSTPSAGGSGAFTAPGSMLTTEGLVAIQSAAIAKATELGVPSVIAIIDASGVQQAFLRMQNAPYISFELAPIKAFSALAFGAPTADVAKNLGGIDDPTLVPSLLAAPRITLIGGGIPITVDGALIGAIGVSGGPVEQDIEVAEAGLAALLG